MLDTKRQEKMEKKLAKKYSDDLSEELIRNIVRVFFHIERIFILDEFKGKIDGNVNDDDLILWVDNTARSKKPVSEGMMVFGDRITNGEVKHQVEEIMKTFLK